MSTCTRLLASALLVLLFATLARADDSNFRPYVIGERAAGMAGAFTATADDGSGPFYNPGGLAFAPRSELSLSGSVYGIVHGSFDDALGNGRSFKYSSLNTVPSATGAVWKLGRPESTSGHVLALGVYVPDAINADDRDTIGSRSNAFFLVNQLQTVWAGPAWAYRSGRIGIGAAGFFLFGTRLSQLDVTVVDPTDASRFATLTQRIDSTTYGVVGALGIRWDASDRLRLGLSVYSPAVGGGSRRAFARETEGTSASSPGSPSAADVLNADGLHASPSEPLRAQLGLAFTSGALTVAADAIFLAGREVVDDAGTQLERRVTRNPVLNGAVGLEYLAGGRFPLSAGLFTDFAASGSPPQTGRDNTSHVDRFGGTASIGFRSDHASTTIGVNVSGGSGQDLVPDQLDFTKLKVSGASQLLLYVFLGTSYQF